MKLTIAITDCGKKHLNYENWVLNAQKEGLEIEIVKLSYHLDNFDEIQKCQGVLFSGGEDIHPQFYHHPEYLELCNQNFMDVKRDEFELKICEYVFKHNLPILGICRGLQLVNVYLGGTLVPDIPFSGGKNHSMLNEFDDEYHSIKVLENTLLESIVTKQPSDKMIINSAHHQSTDTIAKGLRINSLSEENIIEGLEWKSYREHPFLLLVQWHPERMLDLESVFSRNIRDAFLHSLTKTTLMCKNSLH